MTTARTTVGFLYPGHAAEDDYPRAAELLNAGLPAGERVNLIVEHTYGEDLHAIAELMDLGSADKLAGGAERLKAEQPDAVFWACTSGSFVFGWDDATDQVNKLAEAAGVPASSTSFAFVDAAHALGVKKVAIAASYPDEVAQCFVQFLTDGGLEVVRMTSHGIDTAAEVGDLPEEKVIELVTANDHPDADAVLIPDTAMRTFALVENLEKHLGKPVLTANQVTIWKGLRIAGDDRVFAGAGSLFQVSPTDSGEDKR